MSKLCSVYIVESSTDPSYPSVRGAKKHGVRGYDIRVALQDAGFEPGDECVLMLKTDLDELELEARVSG